MTTRGEHFRPDIEGLRAVAILVVLAFHIGLPGAAGGFVGVDVFFVISGFLITGMLVREHDATGRIHLTSFYARRMRRLLPAAVLVIVVTAAVSVVVVSVFRIEDVVADAAASALYLSNIWFTLGATDYFGSPIDESPFLHYWSLAVEEQFYLVWPLLVAVVARRLTLRWLRWMVGAIAVGSFALSVVLTETNAPAAFFMLHSRAWQLALGALVALGSISLGRWQDGRLAGTAGWAGLGMIAASVVVFDDATPYPGVAALLPTVGAVLVVAAGLSGLAGPGRLLSMAAPRFLGRISYPLYLWHWPLLILVPLAIGTDETWVRVALGGVAIVMAAATTRLVEDPIRLGRVLRLPPRRSVGVGLAASVAVAVAVLALPSISARMDPAGAALLEIRSSPLHEADADGCHISGSTVANPGCTYGSPDPRLELALFGDSHALQWLPALEAAGRERGWRVTLLTKSSCTPFDLAVWRPPTKGSLGCDAWRDQAMAKLASLQPDGVLVTGSRGYSLATSAGPKTWGQASETWQSGMEATIARLSAVTEVILIPDTPRLQEDPLGCIASKTSDPACRSSRQDAISLGYERIEQAAADGAGATVMVTNGWICSELECPLERDGTVVYYDDNHLYGVFVRQLADRLADRVGVLLDKGGPSGPSARRATWDEAVAVKWR